MKTNNAIYNNDNKNSSKIKKSILKKKKAYKCIFQCQINPNDCINSIDLIDDKVVFGTLMGDVLLCRVDENKLNGNNKENQILKKRKNARKSLDSSPNKSDSIENDQSHIILNHRNSNKCDCIKLSNDNNNGYNDGNVNNGKADISEDNVRVYNKKNNNEDKSLKIKMNYNSINNDNDNDKNNENKYFTNEDNNDDEDENSNKYEKKLINKNMGKTQSSKESKCIKLNLNKIDSKLFNENKVQNKNNNIKFPQITKLIIRSKENIPCLEFENNDVINISIGDLEVIRLGNMSTFNINDDSSTYNYSKLRNYKTENDHIEFCESCTCMMKNSCYLIVFTKFANYNSIIEINDVKYDHKNLKQNKVIQGTIKMSNYVVPFDFDGDQFLFLDYISKEERRICVAYTASKKEEYHYIINKNYGHISHMKLLQNNKIFLCKNDKECEIHLMNEDFEEIEKWIHIGEDVISCCIYKNDKNINMYNNDKINNYEKYGDENNDTNVEKNKKNIKINILKLIDKNKNIKRQKFTKKPLININQTVNIESFYPNTDQLNKFNVKSNYKKSLISSNSNDNQYHYTESNHMIFNKNNLIINNMHSLNPSFDNSSRRDIFITIENKKLSSNRNSKSNSTMKYNLITSDKKKKNSKNSISSIEIYDKKKRQNGNDNKLNKQYYEINEKNEDAQTIINNRENKNYSIITLDKNGSVNIFNNKKQKTLFNLYNINNIDQKFKNLEFFSVGFPYYILANKLYCCITTDHGLFVISKYSD